MAFRRENDRISKLNAKSFRAFKGSHYGYGKCDQPDMFAYIVDFVANNEKLEKRDGQRKNSTTGYPATITEVMNMNLGGANLLGVVVNGAMIAYPTEDVLEAIRRYYTVREVRAGFTVTRLTAKEVNDLIKRAPR
ncbi:hypothetical protein D4R42_01400 [bacterium]|nr:MAG: hypothetical protein D4R42_01400 [bacterium]